MAQTMTDSEKAFATAIFGWTRRRILILSVVISAAAMLVFGAFSLMPAEGEGPHRWRSVVILSVLFGPAVTTCGFLYCRYVKGPLTLARLRAKGRTDAVEFCLNLMGNGAKPTD